MIGEIGRQKTGKRLANLLILQPNKQFYFLFFSFSLSVGKQFQFQRNLFEQFKYFKGVSWGLNFKDKLFLDWRSFVSLINGKEGSIYNHNLFFNKHRKGLKFTEMWNKDIDIKNQLEFFKFEFNFVRNKLCFQKLQSKKLCHLLISLHNYKSERTKSMFYKNFKKLFNIIIFSFWSQTPLILSVQKL